MANESSALLKISSNLEIPQNNRKNFSTENEVESNTTTDCPDEKPSESQLRKNTVTDTTRDVQEQDDDLECLKAEKLLKALLAIDTDEKQASDSDTGVAGQDLVESASERSVLSESATADVASHSDQATANVASNSDQSADFPTLAEAAKIKRRRKRTRRTRTRKGTKADDTSEHSTTDPEVQSTTSVSKSSSRTTCSSGMESAEVMQCTVEEVNIEISEESDSAISQDATYQDLVAEEFVLDVEQRMIKENLFIEHEKLAKEVAAFEVELTAQLKKSEAMEESLIQLKTDNALLLSEKTILLEEIKVREDEITSLAEKASTIKVTCDALSQTDDGEVKAFYIELDKLKGMLLTKDDELALAKRKHENEYKQLAKNHGKFLGEILTETQEINTTLSTAFCSSTINRKLVFLRTNNVVLLLKQLKEDITTLCDKFIGLEITVKRLRDEVEEQAKTLTKVSSEKKLLKEQVVEAKNENKMLAKEKTKLERDNVSLKAEATRAKNMSQTCKARVEELKATARSAKRENETSSRERQNLETVLKNLGIDCKTLLLNANEDTCAQSKEKQDLKNNSTSLMQNKESLEGAEAKWRLGEDQERRKENSNAITSAKLKSIITQVMQDGFCLKRITELMSKSDLNAEMLVESLYCNCGCYKDDVTRKRFLEIIPPLPRCLELRDEVSNEELVKLRSENNSLKQERSKHEKSLANYKELVRGYTHVVRELEERVVGAREMKCINRELEKYSVLLEQQIEGRGVQLVGINEGMHLIHAMYQRLKSLAGNFINTDLSIPTPGKSLEQTNKFLKEKVAYSEYNISLLKATLERKRTESIEVQSQIHEALFGNDKRPSVEPPEQKSCKKARGSGLLGFMKRKNENELIHEKVELKTAPVSEKQLVLVIDLVQCKEQLFVGIQESIDLEERLERLGKASREYTQISQGQDYCVVENKTCTSSTWVENKANLELLKCLKEKERIENEFSFKEAQTRLLEKQITLLKSERKACLKALRRYEKEMNEFASNSLISALARLLSSAGTSNERNLDGNLAGGSTNDILKGKIKKTKDAFNGSNV